MQFARHPVRLGGGLLPTRMPSPSLGSEDIPEKPVLTSPFDLRRSFSLGENFGGYELEDGSR